MGSRITLYGKQKVDYLIVSDKIPKQSEIDIMQSSYTIPTWNTVSGAQIFCPYTKNLISTYIEGLTSPIDSWEVYRQKKGEMITHKVAQLPKDQLYIVDYLVANNTEYRWEIIPITRNEVGTAMTSIYYKTDWWDYSLTGLAEISPNVYAANEVWTFDLNLVSQSNTQILDRTKFQTNTKYPKFSTGKANYIEGGFTCLLGGVNSPTCNYEEDVPLMERWLNFVSKNQECLFKDRKGNIRRVFIRDNSFNVIDEIQEQPNEISLTWSEIGDTEMSVYMYD